MFINFPALFFIMRSRLTLILLGIGCELIYYFYFARTFSVFTYARTLNLIDLGAITQNSHTGFIFFVMAFCALFVLLGLACWEVRQHEAQDHISFKLVFGFATLFALTMVFCYPITAIDVFAYIAQSHILVTHHANPLVTTPNAFPQDPLMALAGQWNNIGSPYGPVGLIIDAIPTLIAGKNVFLNLLLIKGIFALMVLGSAWLIYRILSRYAPQWAVAGTLLFAWNPTVLFEHVANSHNDIIVVFFALLAIFALTREHPVIAFALLILSVAAKYSTAPLLPLFFLYGLWHQPTARQRQLYLAWIVTISSLLITAIYLPFWAGPHTLDITLGNDNWYLSSASVLLADISSFNLDADHARLISRILFGLCYLYGLFLATRRLPDMIRGCALVMFTFLAFGATKFEPWYAVWAIALLVLVPAPEEAIANLLLSF